MTGRIPEYKYLPARELPPYQLFKRWQKATQTQSDELFGILSRRRILSDIRKAKPELLKPMQ